MPVATLSSTLESTRLCYLLLITSHANILLSIWAVFSQFFRDHQHTKDLGLSTSMTSSKGRFDLFNTPSTKEAPRLRPNHRFQQRPKLLLHSAESVRVKGPRVWESRSQRNARKHHHYHHDPKLCKKDATLVTDGAHPALKCQPALPQ